MKDTRTIDQVKESIIDIYEQVAHKVVCASYYPEQIADAKNELPADVDSRLTYQELLQILTEDYEMYQAGYQRDVVYRQTNIDALLRYEAGLKASYETNLIECQDTFDAVCEALYNACAFE